MIAWAFYDWANSAFATTVMAGFFPVFFKQYWNAGVVATESTFRLGVASGISSLVVALLAPVLGAIADRSNSRVRLLMLVTVLGAAATAALALVGQGQWVAAVDALPRWPRSASGAASSSTTRCCCTSPSPTNTTSSPGYGYALGYLGGGLLFALNVLMTLQPAWFGLADAAAAVRVSFLTVGVWWFVFALPCVFFVREKSRRAGVCDAPRRAVRQGFARTAPTRWPRCGATGRSSGSSPRTGCTSTASTRHQDGGRLRAVARVRGRRASSQALLLTQFVGLPGGAWPSAGSAARIGPRKGIFIALAVYSAATCYAYFIQSARDFYLLAVVIGLVQGGVQSLSRSYFGRLVPEGKSSEFFGFYNMMGKFAAVLGPLLTGIVARVTGDSRLSILSILVLFVAGAALLLARGCNGRARSARRGALANRERLPLRSRVAMSVASPGKMGLRRPAMLPDPMP